MPVPVPVPVPVPMPMPVLVPVLVPVRVRVRVRYLAGCRAGQVVEPGQPTGEVPAIRRRAEPHSADWLAHASESRWRLKHYDI